MKDNCTFERKYYLSYSSAMKSLNNDIEYEKEICIAKCGSVQVIRRWSKTGLMLELRYPNKNSPTIIQWSIPIPVDMEEVMQYYEGKSIGVH